MCRTKCKKYFVKEMKDCDHESLLEITPTFVEHLLSQDSFVARFVMHFHKSGHGAHPGKNYVVMNSWVPVCKEAEMALLLDLKGTADDKTLCKV